MGKGGCFVGNGVGGENGRWNFSTRACWISNNFPVTCKCYMQHVHIIANRNTILVPIPAAAAVAV